jgi:WD40 repeat protein
MAPVTTRDEDLNPFPGLRPFSSGESEYFFGREAESKEVTVRASRNRFLAIIGVSGSGKTSLLQGGLVPGIKNLSLNGPPAWVICNMTPGSDPFAAIADSFAENLYSEDQREKARIEIPGLLRKGQNGIDEAIKAAISKFPRKIVLIIDQFEELFRYGSPGRGKGTGDETATFINLLTHTVTKGNQDFHLVVAIRSDLLSECARYRGLTALLNDSNYFISGMHKESIRSAIEGPLKRKGVRIDPELVDLLVSEINERTNQLPVLQHVLMRLWTRWKEMNENARPVGFSDFNAIGTVKDSISRDADEIYRSLNDEGKDICEKLFKAITGKGSDNKGIRYPSDIRSLKSVIRCSEDELISVIEKFRNPSISFLTPYSGPLDDNSIIDLSHESLIPLWDRLKKWVDEEAASVQMYLELSESSALYQQGRKGLLKSPDLELAVKWREENKPTVWWAQKYNPAWERAMVYLRTSEKKFFKEEERKARISRWRLRRIRTFASVFAAVAVLAGITMLGAFISKFNSDSRRKAVEVQKDIITAQKTAAEEYATAALKKSLEADSNAVAAAMREAHERSMRENAEMRFLTAEKDAHEARKISDSVMQSNLLTLEQKNEAQRMRMISVAKSMSLRSLQSKGQKDLQALLAYQAYLFNKRSNGFYNDADIYMGLYTLAKDYGNEKYRTYAGHEGQILSMAFVPGRNEFYTSGSDGKVIRWDPEEKAQSFKVVYSNSDIIDVLAVSPKADWLACGTEGAAIKMIPIAGNAREYELKGHTAKIKSLIFSFDGSYLYSAALDGKVLKWDLKARTSTNLASGMMQINSIDISSNGKYIAGLGDQGKALIWNPEQPADAFRLESAERAIRSIRFKPDEDRLAVGYDDGKVEIWDISTRKKVTEFMAHSGEVNDIRFNLKLPQMATSGNDGKLKLWDLQDTSNPPVTFNDNGGMVIAFGFSPDGQMIASATVESKPLIIQRPTLADAFVADGCTYVTRNFTPEEWTAFVGKDITYEKTCPGADLKIKIREIR